MTVKDLIRVIVSGGQTGADQAGLRAAKAAGIPTAGWMPRHFLTEAGLRPEFAGLYGLREMAEPAGDYADRTLRNVAESDAMLWFGNPYTPGGKLTFSACVRANIDTFAVIDSGKFPEVAAWLAGGIVSQSPYRLMVAGNRESKRPGIGARVEVFLRNLFAWPAEGRKP